MSQQTIPSPQTLDGIIECFSDCFTQPGASNFRVLIVGWITCLSRHSISRIIQASGVIDTGSKHHSAFYDFLRLGRWSADRVSETLFRLLIKIIPGEITVIIDDTLSHKNGPHIFGAAMHYDAHRSSYGRGTTAGGKKFFAFGHNWVVAALWIPCPWKAGKGIAVPFSFRLYKTKKIGKEDYRKRTDLASDLISLIQRWVPEGKKIHLVADSEYACQTVVKKIGNETAFTGPMCMKAALFEEKGEYKGIGRPPKKGKRLPSPLQLAEDPSTPWIERTITIYGKAVTILTKSTKCLWFTVAGTRKLKVIVTRDPSGRLNDRAYFSTEFELSVEEILTQYSLRWEIEVAFRNTKQSFGIHHPQNGWWRRGHETERPKKKVGPDPHPNKGEVAVNHTLAVAFAAHAIVVLWYFKHGNPKMDVSIARNQAPWDTKKSHPSLADMLAAVRREIWAERLSRNPLLKAGRQKLRQLLPHWLLAA